jgi:hypothetical protein
MITVSSSIARAKLEIDHTQKAIESGAPGRLERFNGFDGGTYAGGMHRGEEHYAVAIFSERRLQKE